MKIPKDLEKRLTARFGKVINLNKNPEVFQEIFEEIAAAVPKPSTDPRPVTEGSPFGVSWMDSWIAHWAINERIMTAQARNEEFASVLRSLVDLKFKERVNELRRFVREYPHFADGPPDGGPPEPGTPPPAGPSSFTAPDGGPPEPGTPPAGPSSFEPPDGGPPEPGVPPTGPDAGFMSENPWVLYWFVSLKAPLVLEMIDAHLTRRMNDIKGQSQW